MSFTLQPVRVATGFDEEGMLVLDKEQRLVAVLVRLSDDNEVAQGQWYLEAGFGPAGWTRPPDLLQPGHGPGLDQPAHRPSVTSYAERELSHSLDFSALFRRDALIVG